MKHLVLIMMMILLGGCAELPEDRMRRSASEPGRASPLQVSYRHDMRSAPYRDDEAPLQEDADEAALSGAMTLDDLLKSVDKSPKLAAAGERIEEQTGAALQGSLSPNPVIFLETEMMPADDLGFGNARNKVRLSQRFELAGKAGARVSLAMARKDEAEALYFHERNMLMADVAKTFADVLYVRRKAETRGRIQALERALLEQAEALNRQGRFSDRDLIAYQVALQKAQSQRMSLEAEEKKLLRTLEGYLGWSSGTIEALAGEPLKAVDKDLEQARHDLVSRNCQLVVLDRQRQVALADLDGQERIAYTDVNVGVSYTRGAELTRERDNFVGAFVEIPFPLVDRNQGGIQRAQAAVRQTEAEMEAEACRLLDELQGLYEQRRIQQDSLLLYQDRIIPLLEKELLLVNNEVETGRQPVQRGLEAELKKEEAVLTALDLEEQIARIDVQVTFLTAGDFLTD